MAKKKDRQRCFVIMPFGKTTPEHTEKYWTEHYRTFLKPLIEENINLQAYRSKPLRVDILREIITSLVTSPVVVADLTDHNCNVYWELGVRQSYKHGTVTIAQQGTELPFDIGSKGTLFYTPDDHLKIPSFRKNFKEAIRDCLQNPERPDSHVMETLSGRGTLFEIFRREEAIRRLDAVLSECEWNLEAVKMVAERSRENIENPNERKYLALRCMFSAIELLWVNRYVEENASFFALVSKCLNAVISLNEQMGSWQHEPARTEQYFINNEAAKIVTINALKNKVAVVRKTIAMRY